MAEFNLFKEWARMVKADDKGLCTIECETCDFYKPAGNLSCVRYVLSHPDEAEAIIRKWAEKHPRKTRQSEFLKIFPDVDLLESGVVDICPVIVGHHPACKGDDCAECLACDGCKEKFWLEEIE